MRPQTALASLAASLCLCAAQAADEGAVAPPIRIKSAKSSSAAEVARALGAYLAGDLALARQGYEAVLVQEPRNRAALLGVATIALRQERYSVAEEHYQRAIEADPQDVWARAGLLNLKAMAEPQGAESRLKSLSEAQPGNFYPHFALGNLYALLGRWNEARRAYQRAVGADPGNPDALFNLAVGLDHLRQPTLAASYYRQALAAASTRPTAASAAAIAARLAELAPAAAQ